MFPNISEAEMQTFQQNLAHFNVSQFSPTMPPVDWRVDNISEYTHRQAEGHFLEALRAEVAPLLPNPSLDIEGYITWFNTLVDTGLGQKNTLFDWLAVHASRRQLCNFLSQEFAGEAGFEDLLAYTFAKLPIQAKLECARNFWDEIGHGRPATMHGPMLSHMMKELNLAPIINETVWESLALSNTMVGLATTRRYAYQSIGALCVIQITTPQRAKKVALGMKRLGLHGKTQTYFEMHAVLDVKNARSWIREVIRPLIESTPACAKFIAEGALMRLLCGERCYKRYQLEFKTSHLKIGQAHRQQQLAA